MDDIFDIFHKDPDKLDIKGPVTEYKWKGKMSHISPNVAQKVKSFVEWMKYEEGSSELHDDFLFTLTRERYINFRDQQIKNQPLPTLPPSHHESQQHMTSSPSELKQPTQSESKIALNNFKKGTKRDASVYPIFKNDKYYDTFQRSFLANLKAQDLYDVADPDYDPRVVISMNKNFSKESNPLYILFWLLHSKQKRGENWSRNLKGMQDPSS